ncbi:hypothetical protein ACG74X_04895 [Marivita sp. S0852]|uniref:hypothetical protein n=1 Tax=Marivita sp. S0852 TaxID=3373893 RepID=UPI003982298E
MVNFSENTRFVAANGPGQGHETKCQRRFGTFAEMPDRRRAKPGADTAGPNSCPWIKFSLVTAAQNP